MRQPRPADCARRIRLPGRRVLVLGFLMAFVVSALIYLTLAPRLRLDAYHRQLVRQGERLVVADLVQPAQPEAVAAALRFLQLSQQLPIAPPSERSGPPTGMAYVAPGEARAGWQQPYVPVRFEPQPAPGSTNALEPLEWKTLDLEIAPFRNLLNEIHAVLGAESFDWNLDYALGPALLLPHLAPQKRVAQWFVATISNDLHADRLDSAHAALLAQVRLVQKLEHDATLISQLVATALGTIAFGSTWEAWQANGWSDPQLSQLQSAWTRLQFLDPMTRSMELERVMGIATFALCRRDLNQLPQLTAGLDPLFPLDSPLGALLDGLPFDGSGVVDAIRLRLWRWRWSYLDELTYLEQCQSDLETLRGSDAWHSKFKTLEHREAQRPDADSRFLLAELTFPVALAVEKAVSIECLRNLAITAIALKRYHQANSRDYPQTLDQLVPRFLSEIPPDPYDGQSLRYRRETNDRFTLYSIARDGVDDSGDPTPPASKTRARFLTHGRDIVWPWPPNAMGSYPYY